jgi:hypothetical protein
MNSRNLVLIVALALAGICGLFWAFSGSRQPAPSTVESNPEPQTISKSSEPLSPAIVQPKTPETKPAAPAVAEVPIYESQIDQVLRSNVGEAQTAKILINMLPSMPEDGQVEAAQHIANLLPDSDYQSVLPILLNPNLPESVTSVLFTDLMNRSDATKLNAFVDIAQVPNHPNQEEAVSDLQIFLDHDYGTDWGQWKSAVAKYLAQQAAQQ